MFSYKQQVNVFHFPVAAGKDSNTLYLVSCLHLHISPFRLGADLSIFAETLLHRNALPLPWQQYRTQGKEKKGCFYYFLSFSLLSNIFCCSLRPRQMCKSVLRRKESTSVDKKKEIKKSAMQTSAETHTHTHTHTHAHPLSSLLQDVARPPVHTNFL